MVDTYTLLSAIGQRIGKLRRWAQNFDASSSSAPASPLPCTLQDDLVVLQRRLLRIEADVTDTEGWEIYAVPVPRWLRELRGAVCDAHQVLNEFEYEFFLAQAEDQLFAFLAQAEDQLFPLNPLGEWLGVEQVGGFTAITSPLDMDLLFWGRIANMIREIRERFEEIPSKRDILNWRLEYGWRIRRNLGERPPNCYVIDPSYVQGQEGDVDKLINRLLLSEECCNNKLAVIPVVGMPGVGKTRLVQLVLNNARIKERFDRRGWVTVSDEFDVIRLTRYIVESFTGAVCDIRELKELQSRLVEVVKGKRFLLVLDDVWNEIRDLWKNLQCPLNYGEKGSAIITTTRSQIAARIMQTVPFHRVECVSDEDCWAIFRRFAFVERDLTDNEEWVKIGRKIAQKCKGLPLAAKSLGIMLSYESNVDKWERVLRTEMSQLDGYGIILPALMLSYRQLPWHLKCCFAYCSLFPKDYTFEIDELVLLWMAQGFIQHQGTRQAEDIGLRYVDELIQRSFFQCYDLKNKPTFVLHDIIHDLAQYVSKEDYFRMEGEKTFYSADHCYLSIASRNHDVATVLESLPSSTASGMRALHLFEVNEIKYFPSILVSNFKGLRTLILSGQPIVELPDSIGDLKHLRYLDMSGTKIAKLPETVRYLYHLQTLLLRHCKYFQSTPTVVLKLTNLRYLRLSR